MATDQGDERFYAVRLATKGVGYTVELWRDSPARWVLLAVVPDVGTSIAGLQRSFSCLETALLFAEALVEDALTNPPRGCN